MKRKGTTPISTRKETKMDKNKFIEFSFNCKDATPDELQWAIFDARTIIMSLNARVYELENTRSSIPVSECVHGGLYRLRARNFSLGVYTRDRYGFVGIRQKFGYEYPSLEFHRDVCRNHGTAIPLELLDETLPEGLILEDYKHFDYRSLWSTDRWADDPETKEQRPVHRIDYKTDPITGKPGYRYYWADTGELVPKETKTYITQNKPLFDWLKRMEEKYEEEG